MGVVYDPPSFPCRGGSQTHPYTIRIKKLMCIRRLCTHSGGIYSAANPARMSDLIARRTNDAVRLLRAGKAHPKTDVPANRDVPVTDIGTQEVHIVVVPRTAPQPAHFGIININNT